MRTGWIGATAFLITAGSVGCAALLGVDEDDYSVKPVGKECAVGVVNACYPVTPDKFDPSSTLDVGPCKAGLQPCVNGVWAECEGAITPVEETCNGVDDDCDGVVDDIASVTCGLGECVATVAACEDGILPECRPKDVATPEVCDGLDNDCDGEVDEGNPDGGGDCDTKLLGVCQRGTKMCLAGVIQCVSQYLPEAEKCDGLDNDCDGGDPDEDNPGGGAKCKAGEPGSSCEFGVTKCEDGAIVCIANKLPQPEVCEDGFDDDCDGKTGEVFFDSHFSAADSWSMTGGWEIAQAKEGCYDPPNDATENSVDKKLAGVRVGTCVRNDGTDYGQLTSPEITIPPGSPLLLKYKRWLHSTAYMKNTIEVRDSNWLSWKQVWASQPNNYVDAAWFADKVELNQFVNPDAKWIQLRWTYDNDFIPSQGGWSIDDVQIVDDECQ